MIGEHRVVALIPARGGSKGLRNKNLRTLSGKTLLRWTIEIAQQVAALDAVVVSTDDGAIAHEARSAGAEVAPRPGELATDDALVIDAIRHHLQEWEGTPDEPGVVVLLQPTSPLRSAADVEACLRPLAEDSHDTAATFSRCNSPPQRLWRLVEGCAEPYLEGPANWLPRQALPDLYEINGAVYAFRAARLPATARGPLFGRIAAVPMPPERSIDIDTALDLLFAETLLAAGAVAQPSPVNRP